MFYCHCINGSVYGARKRGSLNNARKGSMTEVLGRGRLIATFVTWPSVGTYISAACEKASSRVYWCASFVSSYRSKLNCKYTLKAAVLPFLTYCGLTCHFCSKSDSNKLERINERVTHVPTGVYDSKKCFSSGFLTRKNRKGSPPLFLLFEIINVFYCASHKHANSEVQNRLQNCVFRCRQSS